MGPTRESERSVPRSVVMSTRNRVVEEKAPPGRGLSPEGMALDTLMHVVLESPLRG
jgi:hypothetical protein